MTCLTSFKAREALRQMAKTNREFWAELSMGGADDVQLPDAAETHCLSTTWSLKIKTLMIVIYHWKH